MTRHRKQRGAQLVEFAMVMLALMMFILGFIDFGRAYNVYQVMVNAAREGARFGVTPDAETAVLPDPSAIETRVRDFLASGSVTSASVTVDQSQSRTINNVPTTYTLVEVTSSYQFLFFPVFNVSLAARSEMRNETN